MTISISDLPVRLRELADRFEAANLPDCNVHMEIKSHDCAATRAELAQWVRFIGGNVELVRSGSSRWIQTPYCSADVRYVKWFEMGLLGGKTVEVVEDDAIGLEQLMAESCESEKAVV